MGRKGAAETDDVQAAEVERIADVGLSFDPDPQFATGDCRDAMLNVLRTSMDWSKLSEGQQRDINAQVAQTAETIVAKLVAAIASEGRQATRAKLEQITVKDGLKLVLTANHDHDTLVLLGDMQGKFVSLVAADVAAHTGQRAPARVDPDQPDMLPQGTEGDADLVDAADPVATEISEDTGEAEGAPAAEDQEVEPA